jgi:glycosyltransferase involved in cell wall biosynthesis
MNMISIIIPVYNQAEKLAKCLESIANQTFTDYEVIVVNDGSSDNVKEVIEDFKKKLALQTLPETRLGAENPETPKVENVKLINQKNQGANAARNQGAKEAKGEFLLFCDADAVLAYDMLESMMEALKKHPKASYAYSSFKFGRKIFKLFPFNTDKLKKMPYIHTTSLIRTKDWPTFDEKIKRLQDWDLWLTMLEQGKTGVWINKVLFEVVGGGTMSTWLPSFAYKLLPWLKTVKKYNKAVAIIKAKHNLL